MHGGSIGRATTPRFSDWCPSSSGFHERIAEDRVQLCAIGFHRRFHPSVLQVQQRRRRISFRARLSGMSLPTPTTRGALMFAPFRRRRLRGAWLLQIILLRPRCP
jgi:hypothetical protein